jgi:hypothetical protein
MKTKGADYAGNGDELANFKQAASSYKGLTPFDVWYVYAYKHWCAIATFCSRRGQVESEPIEDRLADLINYLLLLNALAKEAETETTGAV